MATPVSKFGEMLSKLKAQRLDGFWNDMLEYLRLGGWENREDKKLHGAAAEEQTASKQGQLQDGAKLMDPRLGQTRKGADANGLEWSFDHFIGIEGKLHTRDVAEDLEHSAEQLETLKKQKSSLRRMVQVGAGALFGILFIAGLSILRSAAPDVTPAVGVTDTPIVPISEGAVAPEAVCIVEFLSPAPGDAIPVSGPLDVAWTAPVGAVSYALKLELPEGAGNPWLMNTDQASRVIYMENFPAGGSYRLEVSAADAQDAVLCSGETAFDKPEGPEPRRDREPEGNAEVDAEFDSPPVFCDTWCQ